jgi:hypothetical protein
MYKGVTEDPMEQIQQITPGERAAYASGKEITTPEQMAVCYLCAEARVLNRDLQFGPGIGNDIALECGMSPETFRRVCNKFELVMTDRHEDEEFTKAEAIYPKILKFHSTFAERPTAEVREMAHSAFTPENRQTGQKLHEAHIEKTKKYAENAKKVDAEVRFKLIDVFNALRRAGINGDRA